MRRFLVPVLTVVGLVTGVAAVSAQDMSVNIDNAPPNTDVQVNVSGPGVSDSATATSGPDGTLALLLDFGSLGKAQPTQVQVSIDTCADSARVYLVAQGGSAAPPEEDGCNRRVVGFLLRNTTRISLNFGTGVVSVSLGHSGFVGGVGVDIVRYRDSEVPLNPAFSRTLSVDRSGTDFSVFGEYLFASWMGVGFGWEGLSDVNLAATLTFIENPRITVDSEGTSDPWVVELYARPTVWFGPRANVHGMIGASYFQATTRSTETLRVDGEAMDDFSDTHDNSGWGGVYGVGAEYWFLDWLGVRGAYKLVQLKQDPSGSDEHGFDEWAHAGRVLVVVGWLR